MEQKYRTWIEQNVTETYGACAEVTEAMAETFPELTRTRGFYVCPAWGSRDHWWLTTLEGDIVDPTAAQFPSQGKGAYQPLNEGAEEPTGRCMNCGKYVFGGHGACSAECAEKLTEYYGCSFSYSPKTVEVVGTFLAGDG